MSKFKFSCGCEFDIVNDKLKDYDGLPSIKIDYYNLPVSCSSTWNLLGLGRTRGVFQLESNFGKQYCKKLAPDNLEHLGALGALLRPGCIQSVYDGKNMTDHYIDRKHGTEPVEYIDDRLKDYYGGTFGILVYQEQMIMLAKGLAGFTPELARKLMKGCAKKDVELLFSLREKFIDGCVNNNVSLENANLIFDNIESSGRYSFNKSHSIAYGKTTYATALMKTLFPLHFFTASLNHTKDMDERRDLISEISLFDIEIKNPSISHLRSKFSIKDGYIQYGYGCIKDVGSDAKNFINKIKEVEISLSKKADKFTWYEFLVNVGINSCKTTVQNLLSCGLLDNTELPRNLLLHEYNTLLQLKTSKTKLKWISENWTNYTDLYSLLEGLLANTRECDKDKIYSLLASLRNPGKSLDDSPKSYYKIETELMGVAISADPISNKERLANIKCASFNAGKGTSNLKFVVVVKNVKEKIVKQGTNQGKKYANLILEDKTGNIETAVFTKEWMELKPLLVEGNVVLVNGYRNKDGSFKIKTVDVI
jgi:DNA polymerase-3 subunit alpha